MEVILVEVIPVGDRKSWLRALSTAQSPATGKHLLLIILAHQRRNNSRQALMILILQWRALNNPQLQAILKAHHHKHRCKSRKTLSTHFLRNLKDASPRNRRTHTRGPLSNSNHLLSKHLQLHHLQSSNTTRNLIRVIQSALRYSSLLRLRRIHHKQAILLKRDTRLLVGIKPINLPRKDGLLFHQVVCKVKRRRKLVELKCASSASNN